jgi:hypothetical protein
VVVDGVGWLEPVRSVARSFVHRFDEPCPDLPDWAAVRLDVDSRCRKLLGALETALLELGLETAPAAQNRDSA